MKQKILLILGLIVVCFIIPQPVSAQQACIRANPSVSIGPIDQYGISGQTIFYIMKVTNNDNAACGDSLFWFTASVPSGWSASPEPSLIIPPETTYSDISLRVTSSSAATNGTYPFTANVRNSSATSFRASASANFVIVATPTPTAIVSPTLPPIPTLGECRAIRCSPPAGCSYVGGQTVSCDPAVVPTCGTLICPTPTGNIGIGNSSPTPTLVLATPTQGPRQKELVRITVDGQEVYCNINRQPNTCSGQNSGINLDLRSRKVFGLTIYYVDVDGIEKALGLGLTFQSPSTLTLLPTSGQALPTSGQALPTSGQATPVSPTSTPPPPLETPSCGSSYTCTSAGNICNANSGGGCTLGDPCDCGGDGTITQCADSGVECGARYGLSGFIFFDTNRNGIYDYTTGESYYNKASTTMQLTKPDGSTVTSEVQSSYWFSYLTQTGTYTLTLTVPQGYQVTTPNPVNVTVPPPPGVNYPSIGLVDLTQAQGPELYSQQLTCPSLTQVTRLGNLEYRFTNWIVGVTNGGLKPANVAGAVDQLSIGELSVNQQFPIGTLNPDQTVTHTLDLSNVRGVRYNAPYSFSLRIDRFGNIAEANEQNNQVSIVCRAR